MASYLLVGNPTAQSGRNAPRIEVARALLEAEGLAHDFLPTRPAGGTIEAVREALAHPGVDTVISMGGDGTFAEVAKGILASGRAERVRLAMLPTGTANDQGKSFGLSSDDGALLRNVRVVVQGVEARLDVGVIRGFGEDGGLVREDHFFDSAGWGISPRVLALRNEDRKLVDSIPVLREFYRDKLVYAGALLRTFLGSYVDDDKFDVEVVADGERCEWRNLSDLVVKGTRVYGGLWVLDPRARPDDGRFEVVPFAGKRDWISKAIVHLDGTGLSAEGLAAIGIRHSEGLSARAIDLHFSEHPGGLSISAQLDGEEFPATPRVRIEVLERALRIVVPEDYAAS